MADDTEVGGIAAGRLRRFVDALPPPAATRATKDPVERFIAKVSRQQNGCAEWTGSKSNMGYGWFSWGGKPMLAHRWAYIASKGSIPDGLVIDHLCRNRACVNPDHLECVPMAENTRRGTLHHVIAAKAKRQTHCKRGHPLFGPNLRLTTKGHRGCVACQSASADEWRRANRSRVNEMQRARRAGASK